ncbi:uncharacterized protein [Leptinotarsa decemlineata]|uniref:uncharacterized protein n=1 Tax=Leptinotarsa decemlineata TaxID=7539 RepID=UPI000C253A7C|nr:larval cuticle protein LCP-30-like [Leptinotarsa decemlineata]
MMKFLAILSLIGLCTAAVQYKPFQYAKKPQIVQYIQDKSSLSIDNGAYIHDNSGAYNDDGQYHHDNSGSYIPDDSGRYIHSDEDYHHVGDGNYGGNNIRGVSVTDFPQASVRKNSNSAGSKDYNKYGIIRKIEQILEDGYHYIYETENEILGEEEGHLVNKGQKDEYMDVKGFYKYIGNDNVEYKVEYTVDSENGFVPKGDHIPQLPQSSS